MFSPTYQTLAANWTKADRTKRTVGQGQCSRKRVFTLEECAKIGSDEAKSSVVDVKNWSMG